MFTVSIENTKFTLLEQKTLAMHIICKIFMLIRSNVIRLKIRKYTNIKCKSRYTVQHQRL